jgi:hypothetical protein
MAKKFLIGIFEGDKFTGPKVYSPPFGTPMPKIEMSLLQNGIQIVWMDVTNKSDSEIDAVNFIDAVGERKSGEVKLS